ncbi:nuclease-related domain-containing protein [Streptomyces sp. NPDC101191]|uniref:nuclease-related domain-containing protein n=1 Tax=Streptomyces sp. NPDC101191 TaxID=3366126 RepID=UPI00380BA777
MVRSFFRFPVPDREYVQRVRRHPPSSLLPLIAAVSSRWPTKEDWRQDGSGLYRPWGLADAAWVSLTRGNEYRQRLATDGDLAEILAQYVALDDIYRRLPVGERLEGFLLRVAGQQFTWQEDDFSELARSLALLVHTKPTRPLEVLVDGWERDLLGCPLADYVGLAQLLYTVATHRQGRLDLAWVPEHELTVFEELTTHAAVTAVLERHFATDVAQERARAAGGLLASDPRLRRYTPNPLRSRPLVRSLGCDYLIPVTPAVLGKVSPMGLYYTGNEHYGERFEAFTRDLGELFEQYVGRHLRLLPGADVHSEIVYDKDNKKSVDWIVVLPRLILLVEVKSARPTAGLRLGPQQFGGELTKKLGKAFTQINKSAKLIEHRHPAFAHIPDDRPVFGIVVTMEPYHLINAPDFRGLLPETVVPTVVASAGELEDAVVATDPGMEEGIVSRIGRPPPGGWSLRDLAGGRTAINPILDQAWETSPWGTEHASAGGSLGAAAPRPGPG